MARNSICSALFRNGGFNAIWRWVIGFRLGQFYMYAPKPIAMLGRSASLPTTKGLPKISLVTPVLNQKTFIDQAMQSVFAQDYPELEYIVMDGGSVDGTVNVIESNGHHLAYFESSADKGQADAINRGFAHATGDIMGWLNGDDLLLPGTLRYVADFFEANPEVDVIYGDRIVIDANGYEINRWKLPGHSDYILSWVDYIPQETLFWRRSLWDKSGAHLDTSFHFAMDWDLLVRFRECGAHFRHLPKYLGAFRTHAQQKTIAEIDMIGKAEMDRIRQRCLGYKPSKAAIRFAVAPYVLKHIADTWRSRLFGVFKSISEDSD